MRFSLTISTTERRGVTGNPLHAAVTRLESEALEYHTIGPVIEVSGEWDRVMRVFHETYRMLSEDSAAVVFSMTAQDGETAVSSEPPDARSEEIADRDSFPASDPPGTRPGPA